ncbi:hypothetical protein WJX73_003062 [Symbiochloris irregularis]|uniref:Uncharacterized protein n=1 Tax=Symbiochloris irregularis TaxID=706552 RepID=A0AAW1PRT9_9CHLO
MYKSQFSLQAPFVVVSWAWTPWHPTDALPRDAWPGTIDANSPPDKDFAWIRHPFMSKPATCLQQQQQQQQQQQHSGSGDQTCEPERAGPQLHAIPLTLPGPSAAIATSGGQAKAAQGRYTSGPPSQQEQTPLQRNPGSFGSNTVGAKTPVPRMAFWFTGQADALSIDGASSSPTISEAADRRRRASRHLNAFFRARPSNCNMSVRDRKGCSTEGKAVPITCGLPGEAHSADRVLPPPAWADDAPPMPERGPVAAWVA